MMHPVSWCWSRGVVSGVVLASAVLLGVGWPGPAAAAGDAGAVSWDDALDQPASWYASEAASRMAERVLLYQKDNGGWDKRIDYAESLTETEAAKLLADKDSTETTIDNHATTTELRYLARMFTATGASRYREAFNRGLQWLLDAQYDNGGWPQYYPLREGYYAHITFNDDAMVRVLSLLRDVAAGEEPYAFVEPAQRSRAKAAFDRGIECILATQVVLDGAPTVWCAQHDAKTLEPAKARAYEHPSLSGMETVPIVRLLMRIEDPGPRVVEAVQGAVAWLDAVKLEGVDMIEVRTPAGEKDRVVVEDADADPIWARFYEIGTNRPIFSGRDGVIRYSMSEVERERRAGYRWYTRRALDLLEEDYPAWREKWGVEDVRTARPDRLTPQAR